MKTHTFLARKNQNRQWAPMLRKNPRILGNNRPVSPINQQETSENLRIMANRKVRQGEYLDAIAIFSQLIRRHPNSANDLNNRGLIYYQIGQTEKAIADYNQALQLNPELDSAYNNRANYYVARGQLAEALTDYEKALDLNPGNIRSWINQGITFRELGLYDLALENLDMALILGGLEDHIYAERGRTYELRGDWNCAIADYQRALNILPRNAAANRLRGKVQTWMSQLLEPLSA